MKTLYFADLHGHNFREFGELIEGVNSRLLDCLKVLTEVKNSAIKESVDAVIFLGDLFHLKNNLDSHVVRFILLNLMEVAEDFPVLIIPGNHDYRSWTWDPALLNLVDNFSEKIILVTEPGWLTSDDSDELEIANDWKGDLNIYIEPFTRKVKEMNERLEALELRKDAIFLGHQDIKGVKYYGHEVEIGLDPDLLSKKFAWSFIGHFHASEKIRDNVISVGAPLQHNFADLGGKRGWWIHDSKTGQLDFVENTFSPKFWDFECYDDKTLAPGDPEKDFYRVRIKGTEVPEEVKKLKWKRISFEIEGKEKRRGELRFSDTSEDLIKKYVGTRGGELDHKRLEQIGRKYL